MLAVAAHEHGLLTNQTVPRAKVALLLEENLMKKLDITDLPLKCPDNAFSHYCLNPEDLFLLESIPRNHLDRLSPYAASQWLSTLTIAVKARHKDATVQRLSQDPSYSIERYFTTPHPGPCFAAPRAGIG